MENDIKCNEIFAVWICKEGHYSMPLLYEVCIASWQIKNPDKKVIVYTNTTDLKYNLLSKDVTETRLLEDYFPNLLPEAEEITKNAPEGMKFAHQSDYIRYGILSSKCGLYIDCDLYCISSIDDLLTDCEHSQTPIVMAYEDKMRICNAAMGNFGEDGKPFYCEIVDNYRHRYVKSSYTFNSIKYPILLKNKYNELINILPFKEGFFYPNWEENENGDLNVLKDTECSLSGYGVHLYNTDIKWKSFREELSSVLYTNKRDWWILKDMNNTMDEYINLMVNAETRDIFKDKKLVKGLTELYGEEYLDQFRKVEI